MASEHVELSFESGERVSVRRFSVHEAMSRPFDVEVVAQSENPAIALASIVGKRASFALHSVAAAPQSRVYNGVCSHMALLRAEEAGASTYLFRIVPALWLTSQRREHRIFQRKTLPEIVQQVLSEWGIAPVSRLTATYQKHDFVVQYGESDLDFVSRLLERAGISYFFDFASDAKTELVLADAPHLGSPRPGMPRYHQRPPEVHGGEFVTRVRVSEAVRPGAFTVRDFDFRRPPDYPLLGKAEPAPEPEQFYEQYRYEPGSMQRVDPPDGGGEAMPVADDKGKVRHSEKEGKAAADRALLGERSSRRTVRFETNCNDLAPGQLFAVADHPRHDLTPGDRLLVLVARLEGAVGQKWVHGGEAIYADHPHVPALRTPPPRVHGVQSAVVVGPAGQEIHTDELGRVRVQFPWDRDGRKNDESSCWIRVSQDWAGAGYGSITIPRIGQEVLVAFLEGDPEQPIVVGRVYNEENPVPYELPKHKTRSVWRSASSPGAQGFNEIHFEDASGAELVYHQAQLDMQKLTKREETERIAQDRTVIVGGSRQAVVGTIDATMVGAVSLRRMIAPPTPDDLSIAEQEQPTVEPLATAAEMVASRVVFTTGQATVSFDGGKLSFEAAGDITIVAKGDDVVLEGARTFINTLAPPPAPRPKPNGQLSPGTFSAPGPPPVQPPVAAGVKNRS